MAENDGRRFGSTQKHKAVCSACKKDCEVPFEPKPGRDVFCLECWKKQKR
ncbi:MAG: DNA-directed RNA polymerase [archaeon]|nr:DNA-directed RNA polymerase [archaeon]